MNKDINTITVNQDVFTMDDARIAAKQLFEVQVDDFNELKNEKWYKHLLNAVTFGAGNKKKIITDIRSLSKLQTLFMKVYCENYKGLDSQINAIIENQSKINESVRRIYEHHIIGIKSQKSILELSPLEQKILLLLLCSYTSIFGNEEILKKYRSGIKQTLGIDMPNGEFKPELLAQVNNGEIFYRIITEMCAIDGGLDDFSVPDCIEDAISHLTISSNLKKEVEEQVRKELVNFGNEELVEKYGVADDDLLDGVELADEGVIDEEYTTVIIDKEVKIDAGTSQIYRNKEIYIHADVTCDGEMVFENCTIIYNDTALHAGVKITEKAQLRIIDSTIKCMSYDEKYFFDCRGNVEVKNCKLIDCAYLFEASKDFYISDCEIIDCACGVLCVSAYGDTKVTIRDNVISQGTLKSFYTDDFSRLSSAMIKVSASSGINKNIQFNNNIVKEQVEFREIFKGKSLWFQYIESDAMVISQSTFLNLSGSVFGGKISECYFKDCINSISRGSSWRNSKIHVDNCIFEGCQDSIMCGNDSIITDCQFMSCSNKVVDANDAYNGGVIVEKCVFKNIINDFEYDEESFSASLSLSEASRKSVLSFRRSKERDSKKNVVRDCVFDGINIKKAFLISCDGYEKPRDDVAVVISKCTFSHCKTQRKSRKLIRENFTYFGLFDKEKSVNATRIDNCVGLDKADIEGCRAKNLSINYISKDGRNIGATSSMTDRADN